MSTRFHLNRETGKVGACHAGEGANPRSCPLGGATGTENHYESAAEAQSAYESSMADQIVPATKKTASVGQAELNRRAKEAKLEADQLEIAEAGSERVLSSLAGNPDTAGSALSVAYDRTGNDKTKSKLEDHPNFPLKRLPLTKMIGLARKSVEGRRRLEKFALTDEIDDRDAAKLARSGETSFVLNPNNSVSETNRITALSQSKSVVLQKAVSTGVINASNVSKLRHSAIAQVAEDLKDQDTIRTAYHEMYGNLADLGEHERLSIRSALSRNQHTPSDVLSGMVDNDDPEVMSDEVAVSIYRHPHVDQKTKDALVGNPSVRPLKRLDDIAADSPTTFASLENPTGRYDTPLGIRERRIKLNPYAVKVLGMTDREVADYVRYQKKEYLWDGRYNDETGEYIGFID